MEFTGRRYNTVARIELNLWDAEECMISGRRIIINCAGFQLDITLPEGFELPNIELPEILPEEIYIECRHPPITHMIAGGCWVPGCKCENNRFEEHERLDN